MKRCKGAIWVVLVLGLFLVGCGGGDDDDDDSTTPTPTPTPTGTPEPTFTWISANVLPRCSGPLCHGSSSDGPMTSYAQVTGGTQKPGSCAMMALPRVTAGNSAQSTFYTKLVDPIPCGVSRMPSGGAPLDAAEIQAIQDWIDGGAAND